MLEIEYCFPPHKIKQNKGTQRLKVVEKVVMLLSWRITSVTL